MPGDESETVSSSDRMNWRKPVLFGLILILGIVAYINLREVLTLDYIADKESQLRDLLRDYPLPVFAVAFFIYVSVTGLSLPSAAILSLSFGWYFGFVQGVILVSFASTAGATIAFLMSRYFFRDSIKSRFGEKLKLFDESMEKEGAYYLFTLRLIPTVPFFVINAVMGLTSIRTWTYWWVSQLGMLPGAIVYVYAGSTVGSLTQLREKGIGGILSWQMVVAFILLGIFPLAVKKTYSYFSATDSKES